MFVLFKEFRRFIQRSFGRKFLHCSFPLPRIGAGKSLIVVADFPVFNHEMLNGIFKLHALGAVMHVCRGSFR